MVLVYRFAPGGEARDRSHPRGGAGVEPGPAGAVERRGADVRRRPPDSDVAASLIHLLIQARSLPGGAAGHQVEIGAVAGLALPHGQADLHVGPRGIESGANGVVGNRVGRDERPPVRA